MGCIIICTCASYSAVLCVCNIKPVSKVLHLHVLVTIMISKADPDMRPLRLEKVDSMSPARHIIVHDEVHYGHGRR